MISSLSAYDLPLWFRPTFDEFMAIAQASQDIPKGRITWIPRPGIRSLASASNPAEAVAACEISTKEVTAGSKGNFRLQGEITDLPYSFDLTLTKQLVLGESGMPVQANAGLRVGFVTGERSLYFNIDRQGSTATGGEIVEQIVVVPVLEPNIPLEVEFNQLLDVKSWTILDASGDNITDDIDSKEIPGAKIELGALSQYLNLQIIGKGVQNND